MALLFMDGFDHYDASADIYKKWTSWAIAAPTTISTAASPTPPGGGNVLRLASGPGNSPGMIYKALGSSYATLVMGGWVYLAANLNGYPFFALLDGSSYQVELRVDTSNRPYITRNGTTINTSTVSAISWNTWVHVEWKVTISPTAGAYEIRVNGVNVLSGTGANTRSTANSTVSSIALGTFYNQTACYDSVYALDTTGSVAADFLGVCRVGVLRPASAGNSSQWVAVNAESNAAAVSDPLFDGDSTFIQSSTANDISLFGLSDLPNSGATIYGIQHVIAAKTDGSTRTINSVERIAGVNYTGTDKTPTASWTFVLDPKSTSPATSGAYTGSELNGMEAGVKLKS